MTENKDGKLVCKNPLGQWVTVPVRRQWPNLKALNGELDTVLWLWPEKCQGILGLKTGEVVKVEQKQEVNNSQKNRDNI